MTLRRRRLLAEARTAQLQAGPVERWRPLIETEFPRDAVGSADRGRLLHRRLIRVKLVADEGVDGPIVDRLREEGHDVLYIAELEPGMDDDNVLAQAMSTEAVLLTTDTDSGEFAFRQRRLHTGGFCSGWRD